MNPLVEEAAATAHKLAILQAYPLGTLEVVFTNWRNKDDTHPRGRLVGLFVTDVDEYAAVDFGEHDRGLCEVEARYCVPCLRNFAALCTPLEDGTGRIPAVEVARLGMIDEENKEQLDWPKATAEVQALSKGQKFILVKIPDKNPDYMHRQYYIWDNYAMGGYAMGGGLNTMVIIDQLRAWHFALPVNGRPLIEGVDYLPK